MSERDDLEELLKETHERWAQALEQELDRRVSRLWRASERPRRILKPAFALASIALLFLGAWLYDLSRSGEPSTMIVLDTRYERPQIVLREPGDPVRLTQQIAGVPEQEPALRLVEPGPSKEMLRQLDIDIPAGIPDGKGNRFLIVDSKIVKITSEDESIVIAENLDKPSSLAFDAAGNLLVLESGKGRILRVEAIAGEIRANSPVSVFVEGFASSAREPEDIAAMREERSERLVFELKPEERVEPVYLTVSKTGEVFVGGQASSGEAVVYKIGRKSFKWWKFYCLYRC
uniref:Uncharacterized protein n=2 Tax=Candidatus Bipolaricaulota TaxID=67810 RepID=H5SEV0_9BACT|nr:hypothetical protein HGMM_F17E10C16 [uncultured Acetothermia bacterium]BAL58328.1 hypothetical protein HGMM_OP1C023 [Candidatus Acetothermum autotrophicum]